jgi:hypothetical protein
MSPGNLSDRNKMDLDNRQILDILHEQSALIQATSDMTKTVHRLMIGEPELKRPGLAEIVDGHDRIIRLFTGYRGLAYVIGIAVWQLALAFFFRAR